MHEVRTMRAIVETVLERARRAGAARVVRVELAIGPAGHLTAEVVRQHFAALAAGTIAAGAVLSVTAMPDNYVCIGCGHHFSSLQREAVCPACGGPSLATPGQDGSYLGAIEVTGDAGEPAPGGAQATS
jgi:hydrogenase nickel incorporation protein HypA/HybF